MRNSADSDPKRFERGDLLWLLTAVIALLCVIFFSIINWRAVVTANNRVQQTRDSLLSLRNVFRSIQGAEMGQRGYLLTNREDYLSPFNKALQNLASEEDAFDTLARDNPAQREDAHICKQLVAEKIAEMSQTIQLQRQKGPEQALALVLTDRGKTIMDELQLRMARMENRETAALDRRAANVTLQAQYAGLVTIFATLVLFVLLLIANRKLHREKLQAIAANHAKSSFLANMSHELRTPLNAIIGYSEMLQEEAQDGGQTDFLPDLNRIQTAGKQLLALINSILDLSKIEAGKMDLYLESFSVASLVREISTIIAPVAEKSGNQFDVVCSAETGSMHTDQTKLRQAIINLLSNACKFTANGTVSLAVSRDLSGPSPQMIFTIRDTGIGMTSEQVQKVFEPFTQADASTTRKFGGTGLGLAISQRFVAMLGGYISVSSEPNHGSEFTIAVPVSIGEITTNTLVTPSPGIPTSGVVLAIDDDPTVHDLLRRTLSKHGLAVESALSGEEGLRLARKLHPDAITLDVMMEGLDGWTVLTRLKADSDTENIPVVMVTIVDNRNRGFTLGAADYIAKPIDRDKLVSVLLRYRNGNNSALIVEDDPDARNLLRRSLELEGWKVEDAENGQVALERVAEKRPGIILLDLMMPEMDGFEFVDRLRKIPEGQTIPIIVVTAKEITSEDRARLNGQVSQILHKGAYQLEDLLNEVSRLVVTRVTKRSKPPAGSNS